MVMDDEKMRRIENSKRFREAEERISLWQEIVKNGDKKEIRNAWDEKTAFFDLMREKHPELYSVFRIDEKRLTEDMLKKIAGLETVID